MSGLYNKDAIARANGAKGVQDSKKYYGRESAPNSHNIGWQGEGQVEIAPQGVAVGAAVAGAGAGHVAGKSVAGGVAGQGVEYGLNGGAEGQVAALGVGGQNTKGRQETTGGNIVSGYKENAIQGDLGNQLSNNAAESRANAANNYNRDKGLQDAIEANKAKQGRWANQREGFRDGRQQGFQGDAAAKRASEAVTNDFKDAASSSTLDAANRSFDQAKLDRINRKSNTVQSNQNVRSKKQFYHDKNQGGFNNEGLNYKRKKGNNDFGAQETAQKEARTRANNLSQGNKNALEKRRFEDSDRRRVSNGNQVYKNHNANEGSNNKYARARDDGNSAQNGYKKNAIKQEFDRFQQNNNQQNQKAWDKTNRDFFARNKGNSLGRNTNAIFDFSSNGLSNARSAFVNDNRNRNNGLGGSNFGKHQLGLQTPYNSNNYGNFYSSGQQPQRAAVEEVAPIIADRAYNAGQTHFWG